VLPFSQEGHNNMIQNWLEELKAKVPTGRQAPALFLPIVVSTASSS